MIPSCTYSNPLHHRYDVILSLLRNQYGVETLNHRLFMTINHLHHPLLDPVMEGCIALGSSLMVYVYAALLLLVAICRRDVMPYRYIAVYCLAVAIGIGIEETLKGICQIPRPAAAIGLDSILTIGEVKLRNSFPSGHATFSFVTAYVLGYRRSLRWKCPLYAFALLVAWSRVYVGAHYPLDVTAGALLGMATGFAVWRGYEFAAPRLVKQEPGIEEKEDPS